MNFAIIPDIHASIDWLTKSLAIALSHQLIFLGDLIDGGANPGKCHDLSVLETVKALVDCGRARVVLGNHELNAIIFHRRSNEYNLPLRNFLMRIRDGKLTAPGLPNSDNYKDLIFPQDPIQHKNVQQWVALKPFVDEPIDYGEAQ